MIGVATVLVGKADFDEVSVVVESADIEAVRDLDDDSMFVVPVGRAKKLASARS